jgi:MoaA/NifB/PqqE/SkfB family radical SAM enzyme
MRRNPAAFEHAAAAIPLFREAGVFPALTSCATHDLIADDGLFRYLDLARELGAAVVKVLDPIQAGQLLSDTDASLSVAELDALRTFQRAANTRRCYRPHPAVSVRALTELRDTFGCGAGGHSILHVNASGELQPCGYMGVSTGNLVREPFDEVLGRMRRLFPRPTGFDGSCPANELGAAIAEALSGGGQLPLPYEDTCRICAHFAHRPDPRHG